MGIVSQILKRGLNHSDYPAECPSIVLSKEDQSNLNNGKFVIKKDNHYNEYFFIFKKSMDLKLTKDNIDIRSVDSKKMDSNPVRNQELSKFYEKYPKFSRSIS